MSDFREELIEAMAQRIHDHMPGGYTKAAARQYAKIALDAALAFRQTVECPECGGRGKRLVYEDGNPHKAFVRRCPAGCIDGRVPGETRLAIVEPVGWDTLEGDGTLTVWDAKGNSVVPIPDLFLLAPDLPEGTN